MSDEQFQKIVADFIRQNGLSVEVATRLLDLQSEVGELAKEYLKASEYGRREFQATEDWDLEIGDVLFALAALAEASGVNLELTLESALEKYRRRLAAAGRLDSTK